MDPLRRLADPKLLHPALRGTVVKLEAALAEARIPLALYETFRTPERQVELYKRGRMTGYGPLGKHVTYTLAWESRHQYGLAVDLVFKVDGKWTWDEPEKGMWVRFHEVAKKLGLQPLVNSKGRVIEWPHVQHPYPLVKLRNGEYPPGGDDSWMDAMNEAIFRWGSKPRRFGATDHPPAPPRAQDDERPPLDDVT